MKLRNLEKSLLNALSQSEGNILDNDNIISTLETLKKEAAEVTTKAAETDVVMEEISKINYYSIYICLFNLTIEKLYIKQIYP